MEAFHEPPPLPALSPALGGGDGGEGGRRPGEGDSDRFMVPMHAKKRKGALHEPPHPLPVRVWHRMAAVAVSNLATVADGILPTGMVTLNADVTANPVRQLTFLVRDFRPVFTV